MFRCSFDTLSATSANHSNYHSLQPVYSLFTACPLPMGFVSVLSVLSLVAWPAKTKTCTDRAMTWAASFSMANRCTLRHALGTVAAKQPRQLCQRASRSLSCSATNRPQSKPQNGAHSAHSKIIVQFCAINLSKQLCRWSAIENTKIKLSRITSCIILTVWTSDVAGCAWEFTKSMRI